MLRMTRGQYILDNLSKKAESVNLSLMGNEIISDIIDRTQSGKDSKNNFFKPYSKQYAISKYKEFVRKETISNLIERKSRLYAIRKQKEFGTATVNLTRTQKMLNSITYKEIPKGLRFYFNASEQSTKAYHNQITNKRKFFGLSNESLQKIRKFISKQITK